MNSLVVKNYEIQRGLRIFYNTDIGNKLYLSGAFGIFILYLPRQFFFKKSNNVFELIFVKKNYFNNFLIHFFTFYKYLFNLFFLRLRIKGLGYRIKRFGKYNILRFFFAYSNYIYFHIPKCILVKLRGKRLFLLGNNMEKLNLIFKNLLLLKKLDPYKIKGLLRRPRNIIFLRKKEKKIKGRMF